MGKQKSAAAAGAVATGPVPRPPVLEHTTAELVSLIANQPPLARNARTSRWTSSDRRSPRTLSSVKTLELSKIGEALVLKADPTDQTPKSKLKPSAASFRKKLVQERGPVPMPI